MFTARNTWCAPPPDLTQPSARNHFCSSSYICSLVRFMQRVLTNAEAHSALTARMIANTNTPLDRNPTAPIAKYKPEMKMDM